MNIDFNKRGKAKLCKDEMTQILLSAYSPHHERIVSQKSFLKGWLMRTNSFDALYTKYCKENTMRYLFNRFMFQPDKYNVAKNFFNDMKSCIGRKENLFYLFIGDTGSGKSWRVLDIAMIFANMNKEFRYVRLNFSDKEKLCIDKNTKCTISESSVVENLTQDMYWSYSVSETLEIIKKCKSKSLIVQDEAVIQHGKNSDIVMDNFRNIISAAARREQINVFIINPNIIPLNGIQYYIKILARNEKRQSLCYMYARELNDLGVAVFDFTVSDAITTAYDQKSKAVKERIRLDAGSSGVRANEEEIQKCAIKLIEFTESRRDACTKMTEFMDYIDMVDGLSNHLYKRLICREACRILAQIERTSSSTSANPEVEDETDVDEEIELATEETIVTPIVGNSILADLSAKIGSSSTTESSSKANIPVSAVTLSNRFDIDSMRKYIMSHEDIKKLSIKDREIFRLIIMHNMNFSDISKIDEIGLTAPSISKRAKQYREGFSDTVVHLGKIFQDWANIIVHGKIQDAAYNRDCDLIDEKNKIVYSVKAYMVNQKNYYSFASDFRPEFKYVLEHKEYELHLLYVNFISQNVRIVDVKLDMNRYDSIEIDMTNVVTQLKKGK